MRIFLAVVLGAAVALVVHEGLARLTAAPPTSPGEAALAEAAHAGKYLFFVFCKEEDSATKAMRQALDAALAKRPGGVATVLVKVTDPAEKPLIDRYGLSRAPMPLVLAVAPNGAITGGFPLKLSDQDVAGAFVSPGTATCLKATQARKLVLLCVQPAGAELPAGVRKFKADAQYGPVTEVVNLRGDDPEEASFLKALKIKPDGPTVTVFLAPPGSLLGTFEGTFSKQQLVEKLKAAKGCCCPGGKCGPGGCCPGGKCEPKK